MANSDRTPFHSLLMQCAGVSPRDRANNRTFFYWTLTLAISMLAVTFILKREFITGLLAYPVAAIIPLVALMTVHAYYRLVTQADELIRKIHLEAFSIGFLAGTVYFFLFSALRLLDIANPDPHILFTVMLVGWTYGQVRGARRYL